MPKERNNRVFSSRKSRGHSPYQLNVCPFDREVPHVNSSDAGRSLSNKDWEDALCPICMNPPHNAVLLLCSSHEKGCRTYMCDTSYRHSNCLDQFKKVHSLIPTGQNSDISDESFHPHANLQNFSNAGGTADTTADEESLLDEVFEPNPEVDLISHEIPQLSCPLCRGQVKGWTVVEQARKYLNTKSRSCSHESCSFEGTYGQLRKHARSDHPLARPTEVDPDRQRDWQNLEQERNIGDVISSIRSAIPGAMMFGDFVIDGGNTGNEDNENYFRGDERNWWSFLLLVRFLDQNAHITISRAIPARVRARRSGRSGRNFSSREGSLEASVSVEGDGSNARYNDRFGRSFPLRVENSESGANAQGNVSTSNARVNDTHFPTESSSR
ncbi:hypothetical protein SUGI_0580450 [Cryptomeria japonica]|uniref:uncharacterized protein LOC131069658 n=1 Tax=Cryptomeria japonica TaxID=3369 RepID=UPI0024149C75|nr:uncharacterized protein LOC131069658 [Cryptomeria japonica]GLJ29445.1 hypothetical protein SUGI_0580450 [Cryptomeria japonica]